MIPVQVRHPDPEIERELRYRYQERLAILMDGSTEEPGEQLRKLAQEHCERYLREIEEQEHGKRLL